MRILQTAAVLSVIGLMCVVLTGCPTGPSEPASESARGIVLITVDGLIAEHLRVYGGPIGIPQLEQLAEEGVAWDDAWTAAPMARPAVATYLTGVAPDRHGVTDDQFSRLPESIPTLAAVLAERGYRTAAFPVSDHLGAGSGLLRDFEAVDDPPPLIGDFRRWLPSPGRPGPQTQAFQAWLESLGPDDSFFAWIHTSQPYLAQVAKDADQAGAALDHFNTFLESILTAIDAHGARADSLVVVAGTYGLVTGGDGALPGMGFSLDEAAIQVPLIARFPTSVTALPDAGRTVWAPDVACTLARFGGAELPASECIDLFETPPADRIIFSWSWATRDQMGWKPIRTARLGTSKRIEGLETVTVNLDDGSDVTPAVGELLTVALGRRAEPSPQRLPQDQARVVLEKLGRTLTPVVLGGRPFGTPETRHKVAELVWVARRDWMDPRSPGLRAQTALEEVQGLDPENYAALIDLAQYWNAAGQPDKALPLLETAVQLYPYDPEAVHWYAHGIWQVAMERAEELLLMTLPFRNDSSDILYDLACSRSLAGDLPASVDYLRRSLEAGFDNRQHLATDPDLRHLRESTLFAELMKEYSR